MALTGLPYYPLFLDLTGKACIVVGGGLVAERKVRALLACGAKVRLVSPKVTRNLRKLEQNGKLEILLRAHAAGDLEGMYLVFAATNRAEINRSIREEAGRRNILLNVADDPALCDFIVPSIARKGPIVIAISTSGTLPMLAKRLRKEIGGKLSKDFARYAVKVGRLRKLLMEKVADRKKRQKILKRISAVGISELAAMPMKELRARFLPSS